MSVYSTLGESFLNLKWSPLIPGQVCHCCSVVVCSVVTSEHVEGDACDWDPSVVLKSCPAFDTVSDSLTGRSSLQMLSPASASCHSVSG